MAALWRAGGLAGMLALVPHLEEVGVEDGLHPGGRGDAGVGGRSGRRRNTAWMQAHTMSPSVSTWASEARLSRRLDRSTGTP